MRLLLFHHLPLLFAGDQTSANVCKAAKRKAKSMAAASAPAAATVAAAPRGQSRRDAAKAAMAAEAAKGVLLLLFYVPLTSNLDTF